MKPLKWIAFSVLFVSAASILMKQGVNQVGPITFSELSSMLLLIITNPYIVLGAILYLLSSFTWMLALSKTELSKAYPILSSAYALIPILSWIFFGDVITLLRWLGIGVVSIGALFMIKS